ncbi:hypothetical protein EJD88_11515 [Pseudomonas sp. PB105]|uniref:hypothetical protein n=1 Tax=unclassified Pseudomonas TaxID=196821 RepID=UPI00131C12BF|nr:MULTISPECIES: hypothetical protein [unclassified Pseudomonas]KAE9655738.1 hypothetical protein EJD88_11515 [Pseudomonas sp. PB105]MVW96363.1 hypothetical protein [Pseudomonas sp. PB100]
MKLHYYCFTFYESSGAQTAHASAYYGFEHQRVTLVDIAAAKQGAQVSQQSTLLACSYLGHMTTKEFAG